MKIKVNREVEVPEKYCYTGWQDEQFDCPERQSYFDIRGYCSAFNTDLESKYIINDVGDEILVELPCKDCLDARKKAKMKHNPNEIHPRCLRCIHQLNYMPVAETQHLGEMVMALDYYCDYWKTPIYGWDVGEKCYNHFKNLEKEMKNDLR